MSHNEYNKSYKCNFTSNTSLQRIRNAKNGELFESLPFEIGRITWLIKIFPNGDVAKNNGVFVVLLQAKMVPTLWTDVIICRTIHCHETDIKDTMICTYDKQTNVTRWKDGSMLFNDYINLIKNNVTKLSFTVTIKILQIKVNNEHVIYNRNNIMNKSNQSIQSFQWKIDKHLIHKLINSHPANSYESEIFYNMWCICCYPNYISSNSQQKGIILRLQLCSLIKLHVKYVFKCPELNLIITNHSYFDYQQQNSESHNFITMNQIKDLNSITIIVDININPQNVEKIAIADKTNLSNNNMKLSKNNMIIIDDNSDNDKETNNLEVLQYRSAIKDLIDTFLNPKPRYHLQTNKISKLKELVRSEYSDTIVIRSEDEEDNEYFDGIIEYIELNENVENDDFEIWIGHNSHTKILQKYALEVYTIENNLRCPCLNGQRGLKSNVFIMEGCIIGEYFGNILLENEYDDIYQGTKEWIDINKYAQSVTIDVLMKHSELSDYINIENNNKIDNNNNNNNDEIQQEFNLVFDGLNKSSSIQSMLIYLNDCRKDINLTTKTVEDSKHQNVKLITIFHNGWPKIFAVSTKEIKPNEQLLTFYGNSFPGWQQDKRRYQYNKKQLQKNMKKILQNYKINNIM